MPDVEGLKVRQDNRRARQEILQAQLDELVLGFRAGIENFVDDARREGLEGTAYDDSKGRVRFTLNGYDLELVQHPEPFLIRDSLNEQLQAKASIFVGQGDEVPAFAELNVIEGQNGADAFYHLNTRTGSEMEYCAGGTEISDAEGRNVAEYLIDFLYRIEFYWRETMTRRAARALSDTRVTGFSMNR